MRASDWQGVLIMAAVIILAIPVLGTFSTHPGPWIAVKVVIVIVGFFAGLIRDNELRQRSARYEEFLVRAGIDPRTGFKLDPRLPLPVEWLGYLPRPGEGP